MERLIERGTLPIGVLHDDKLHREFTIEPMRARHVIAARKHPDFPGIAGGVGEDGKPIAGDDEAQGLLAYATRMKIDGIPKEAMGLELMLDLFDEDLDAIQAADGRLKKKIARFRGEITQADRAGTGEDRDAVADGGIDAAGKGPGVDGSGAGPVGTAHPDF
ncbi:MAG: hypothetical protein M0036_04665 [Desulfobacteraceae bacterium]|nr:hypothetical protein [Desulfobacteraceae bacterium]